MNLGTGTHDGFTQLLADLAWFSLKRVSVALRHAEASANVGGRVLEKMRMRRRQSLVCE
jgi:hypothetical protein